MRKDKRDRAFLSFIKTTYEITGLNLDNFINTVKKKGIFLYDIKKYGNKRLKVSVKFKDSQNFFAIAKKLCYNIKKVKESGVLYPFLKIYRSLGILIGALIITFSAIYCDGLIFSFSYSGSGVLYKREVQNFLTEKGIVRFSKFSQVDLKSLEDEILANNSHLSFASCQKVGSTLKIELATSKADKEKLNGNVYSLVSDIDGVVESVKVYRGTSLVSVGDSVKNGQLLVDGFMTIKEQTLKINVLASLSLIGEKTYVYKSNNDKEQHIAVSFAEELYSSLQIVKTEVVTEQDGDNFIYTVSIKYRHVLSVG